VAARLSKARPRDHHSRTGLGPQHAAFEEAVAIDLESSTRGSATLRNSPRHPGIPRHGKKVIAFVTAHQERYYIAAQATRSILIARFVLLDGYGRYRMFSRGARQARCRRQSPRGRVQRRRRGLPDDMSPRTRREPATSTRCGPTIRNNDARPELPSVRSRPTSHAFQGSPAAGWQRRPGRTAAARDRCEVPSGCRAAAD